MRTATWTILKLILITSCGEWSLTQQADNSRSSGPRLHSNAHAVVLAYSEALANNTNNLALTDPAQFTEEQLLVFESELAKLLVKILDSDSNLIVIFKAANRNVFRAARAAQLDLNPRNKAVLSTLPFRLGGIPEEDMKEEMTRNLEGAEIYHDLHEFVREANGLIPSNYADEFPESIIEAGHSHGIAPEKTIETLIKNLATVPEDSRAASLDSTVKMIAKKDLPAATAANLYIEMQTLDFLSLPPLQSVQEVEDALSSVVHYVDQRWQQENPENNVTVPDQISRVLNSRGERHHPRPDDNEDPTTLGYSHAKIELVVGLPMVPVDATGTIFDSGQPVSCSSEPSLPQGLAFGEGCQIHGTPGAPTRASYSITASLAEQSATTDLKIITRESIPVISSPMEWLPLIQGLAITNIALSVSAGIQGGETRCQGRLPPGLRIDGTSCVISGTPTEAAARQSYVVMVSNQLGNSARVTIDITVASDPCPGAISKTPEIRYKDDDRDGYYVPSLFPVCTNNRAYPVSGSALTDRQRTVPDIDRDRVADSDNDSVADTLDQCSDADDLVARQTYLDRDRDGLVTRSNDYVCPDVAGDDGVLAENLSEYQINHFDPDDASPIRNWDDLRISEGEYGSDLNGNGNSNDRGHFYVIANPHQLLDATNHCTRGSTETCDRDFLIVADLDFGDVDGAWSDMHPDDGAYTTNKKKDLFNGGNEAQLFRGVINGLGRQISNFRMFMLTDDLGLIGAAGDGVKILDLRFSGSVNSRGGSRVGLIGSLDGAATLSDVHVDLEIDGEDQVGGLIGGISASSGAVTISGSSVRGEIDGNASVGGLIGFAGSNIDVSGSFNGARVEADGGDGAGIIGSSQADATITQSFNDGDVYSAGHAAGILVGSSSGHNRIFRNVYNSGAIESSEEDRYVSGIAADATQGASSHVFDKVYNAGDLGSPNDWTFGIFEGYQGFADARVSDSVYLVRRPDFSFSQLGSLITAADITKRASFQSWDFDTIWTIVEDRTAPYLDGVTPEDLRPTGFD